MPAGIGCAMGTSAKSTQFDDCEVLEHRWALAALPKTQNPFEG
jgi:hypothetical protein